MHSRLKAIREEKKISQECVAHYLGINQSQYSRRENGIVQFSLAEIQKVCLLLDINISNLLSQGKISPSLNTRDSSDLYSLLKEIKLILLQIEKLLTK